MADLEVQPVTPEELMCHLEEGLQRRKENKYAFQVILKDLDFAVAEETAARLGITLPFQSIGQAEAALQQGVIAPSQFVEDDDTEHRVTLFDPQPVGYSGFQDCVTHSLALTDQGLFETGRFSAVNFTGQPHAWQWFLHRRLATSEDAATWQETNELSSQQVLDLVFEALTGTVRRLRSEEPSGSDG